MSAVKKLTNKQLSCICFKPDDASNNTRAAAGGVIKGVPGSASMINSKKCVQILAVINLTWIDAEEGKH